ncbi:hypothetical protein QOT17_004461 [Balamuthia mandrillaris]
MVYHVDAKYQQQVLAVPLAYLLGLLLQYISHDDYFKPTTSLPSTSNTSKSSWDKSYFDQRGPTLTSTPAPFLNRSPPPPAPSSPSPSLSPPSFPPFSPPSYSPSSFDSLSKAISTSHEEVEHLDRCVRFWHIEKTGGTTLNHILKDTAKLWNKSFLPHQRDVRDADYISGHFRLSVMLEWLESERRTKAATENNLKANSKKTRKRNRTAHNHELCYWFFSQREPLDRFMSRFYYKQLRLPHLNWGNDIEAFVRKEHPGMATIRTLNTEQELQRLMAVLDTFEMVVVAERFDECLILLMEDGVISPEVVRNYSNYGVVQGRPKVESLASDVKEKLREFLELDIRLYEAAMAKLDQRVERFGRERMQQRLQALAAVHTARCSEERGGLKGSGACKNFTEVDKFLSGRAKEKYANL